MSRYVVHMVNKETGVEGYLKRGQLVGLKTATAYAHPSNARAAIKRCAQGFAASIVDLRTCAKARRLERA